MKANKELKLKEQEEGKQRFFVFCLDNNDDLHNVVLSYEDSEDVFRILAMLMDKKGKPIQVDENNILFKVVKK